MNDPSSTGWRNEMNDFFLALAKPPKLNQEVNNLSRPITHEEISKKKKKGILIHDITKSR